MKKSIVFLMVAIFSISLLFAFDKKASDTRFYTTFLVKEDQEILTKELESASSADERYEILWRLSRDQLSLTDEIKDTLSKDEKISSYSKAEEYADMALKEKEGYEAYHWKASSIGRVGQVNGPMNSLKKAKPMARLVEKVQNDFKADYTDSWYVLGLLYNQLPGKPLSFGNNDAAISYMRKCLDTQDDSVRTNIKNYLELANQLWDRDWDKDKRRKELKKMQSDYNKETVPTEKMRYYEGRDGKDTKSYYLECSLGDISDREEARVLLEYGLKVYNTFSKHSEEDIKTQAEATKRLEEFRNKR